MNDDPPNHDLLSLADERHREASERGRRQSSSRLPTARFLSCCSWPCWVFALLFLQRPLPASAVCGSGSVYLYLGAPCLSHVTSAETEGAGEAGLSEGEDGWHGAGVQRGCFPAHSICIGLSFKAGTKFTSHKIRILLKAKPFFFAFKG